MCPKSHPPRRRTYRHKTRTEQQTRNSRKTEQQLERFKHKAEKREQLIVRLNNKLKKQKGKGSFNTAQWDKVRTDVRTKYGYDISKVPQRQGKTKLNKGRQPPENSKGSAQVRKTCRRRD